MHIDKEECEGEKNEYYIDDEEGKETVKEKAQDKGENSLNKERKPPKKEILQFGERLSLDILKHVRLHLN